MAPFPPLDHLVIAAPSLADLSSWWANAMGAPAAPGGAHTGLGTRNELAGLDDTTYVELIGPDPDQPPPSMPRPFGIDGLATRRLVTFAVAVEDLDQACSAVRSAGIDPGEPRAMQRLRPDGVLLAWRLAVPTDPSLAGVMPFLIEWGATAHPAASLEPAAALERLALQHPKHAQIAEAIEAATGQHIDVSAGPAGLVAELSTKAGGTLEVAS